MAMLIIFLFIFFLHLSVGSGVWRPIRGSGSLKSVKQANRISCQRCKELESLGGNAGLPISLGSLIVPLEVFNKPVMIFGLPGSGKTSLITIITMSLMQLFSKAPGRTRFLVLDCKLDNLAKLNSFTPAGIPIHVINPSDARSAALDLPEIFPTRSDLRQLASMMCPPVKGDSSPFFRQWVRDIIWAVTYVFQAHSKNAKANWNFLILCWTLANRPFLKWLCGLIPETKSLYKTGLGPDTDSAADIFSTIRSVIQPFIDIGLADREATETFSFSDFLTNDGVCVLGIPPKSSEVVKPLLSVFLRRLIEEAQAPSHPEDRLILVLDEIAQLDPSVTEAIIKSVAVGRSAGIHVIAATQSLEVMEAAFGQDKAHSFLSCCATIIGFRSSRKTAEYLSHVFGNQEGFLTASSQSRGPGGRSTSTSESFHSRPVVMPEEFQNLPLADPIQDSIQYYVSNPLVGSVFVNSEFMAAVTAPRNPDYPDFIQRTISTNTRPQITIRDLEDLGLPQIPKNLGNS